MVAARYATVGALIAAFVVSPALAQTTEDDTRGVRLLDGPSVPEPTPPSPQLSLPPAPPPAPTPPPVASAPVPVAPVPTPAPAPLPPSISSLPQLEPAPSVASPALPPLVPPPAAALPQLPPPSEPVPQAPALPPPSEQAVVPPTPSPFAPPATASAPPAPTYDVMSLPPSPGHLAPPQPLMDLPTIGPNITVANPAELTVEILPGQQIQVGARVSFRIATKKAGYLILVDVDSAGKLTQIFPNPMSLVAATGDRQNPHANYIKPGKPIQIPDPKAAAMGFEFVASPPLGTAMVVAILSDRPVQLVDMPDVPASLVGQAGALTYLNKMAGELRLPPAGGNGPLQEPQWSLDAKFYAIR